MRLCIFAACVAAVLLGQPTSDLGRFEGQSDVGNPELLAYQQTLDRGMTEDRKPPWFGLDERWQFNLFDPDGTRVEFMQPRDPAKAGTPVPSR